MKGAKFEINEIAAGQGRRVKEVDRHRSAFFTRAPAQPQYDTNASRNKVDAHRSTHSMYICLGRSC